MTLYAPNVVWDGPTVGGNVFEGREVLRGFLRDWIGAYEDFRQVLEEFCDFGNGVTFGVLSQRGRLPGTSGIVALRIAVMATWTDTVIERLTSYRGGGIATSFGNREDGTGGLASGKQESGAWSATILAPEKTRQEQAQGVASFSIPLKYHEKVNSTTATKKKRWKPYHPA
jgi:hypothetical protein